MVRLQALAFQIMKNSAALVYWVTPEHGMMDVVLGLGLGFGWDQVGVQRFAARSGVSDLVAPDPCCTCHVFPH